MYEKPLIKDFHCYMISVNKTSYLWWRALMRKIHFGSLWALFQTLDFTGLSLSWRRYGKFRTTSV